MITNRLFVISCYFDGSNDSIIKCTKSIIQNYNKPNIVVVDSNSPDKSYFKKLDHKHIQIMDIGNKNYDTGAYWAAFKNFTNYENYYFLQDSIRIKKNLSSFEKNSFACFRYFHSIDRVGGFIIEKTKKNLKDRLNNFFKKNQTLHDFYGFDTSSQMSWSKNELLKTSYYFPKLWISVFGPMFICKNIVMKKLMNNNFDKILPTNKEQQMAMERLFGIAIQQEGFNLSNSVQGDNFRTNFSTSDFEKFFYGRK